MNILFFGDIMGKPGRQALKRMLPSLRQRYSAEFIIANGENASGGVGLTPDEFAEIMRMGVDAVTTGNHIWKHKAVYPVLDRESTIVRPANYPEGTPGRGLTVLEAANGVKIALMNLQGRTYLEDIDCPFRTADALIKEIPDDVRIRLIDFHAETTSEKKALGFHLDGRISGLFGTHTHVQTADAMILPKGTGYITDAGMCGVELSCLGMDPEIIVGRFLTRLPQRFKLAKGKASINGVCLTVDPDTGKAMDIKLIREDVE